MLLPNRLQEKRFVDWNYLVRGLVAIWEIARMAGLDAALERRLGEDKEAAYAEWVGHIGSQWLLRASTLNATALRPLLEEILASPGPGALYTPRPHDRYRALPFLYEGVLEPV